MSKVEKYIGDSPLKGEPKKEITLTVKDNAITNSKIADGQISFEKLDETLKTAIIQGGGGGEINLSNDWGNSELMGITQKKLTEAHRDLQEQIDAIIGGGVTVDLSVIPAVAFVGQQYNITITANSSYDADSIVVKKGEGISSIVGTGSGRTLQVTDSNVTIGVSNTILYTAEFVFSETTKTASKRISFVDKIYYGIGTDNSYENITNYQTARTSASGSYQFTPTDAKKYIYILQPYSMTPINLSNIKLDSGFKYNMMLVTDNEQINEVRYRVYRSISANSTETFTLIIS